MKAAQQRPRRSSSISRSDAMSKLPDTDRTILWFLTAHRVATTQEVQQFLELPERTVRYRLQRLRQLSLAGAIRPYADQGSAPHHWYPTKLADAWARGAPVPRGGERATPNPAFLRHAAAVTALYVTLARRGPPLGFAVSGFARETWAREEFLDAGRATAIVPDLTVILDWGEAEYRAFVEVDLGNMSLPRLTRKLAGYTAYVREHAWRREHPYPPTLLMLTTTKRRAEAVIGEWGRRFLPGGTQRRSRYGQAKFAGGRDLRIAATDAALFPEEAIAAPIWRVPGCEEELTLKEVLDPPWREWSAVEAKRRVEQERLRAKEEHLRGSPEARRAHIQEAGRTPSLA